MGEIALGERRPVGEASRLVMAAVKHWVRPEDALLVSTEQMEMGLTGVPAKVVSFAVVVVEGR